jgi:hypothetical protein
MFYKIGFDEDEPHRLKFKAEIYDTRKCINTQITI